MTAAAGRGQAAPGPSTGMVIAGAVGLLALPSAVLAFTATVGTLSADALPASASEVPGSDGPGLRLARGMSLQSLVPRQLYPFTPASNPNRPDRSVTVAVRIDPQAMRTIAGGVRDPAAGGQAGANLRLAQTGFNLGVARGYRNFAQAPLVAASTTRRGDPPDLSRLAIPAAVHPAASRFSSQVVVDDRAAGRASRPFAGDKDEQVDVSGSYRLIGNLNVTAGLRYSPDHERQLPLTDGRQDSQAVYVGTQIRF